MIRYRGLFLEKFWDFLILLNEHRLYQGVCINIEQFSKIYEIDDLIPESYYCYWPQKHNGGVTGPLTTKQ